jgi:seryl-tRNA synthetase
MKQFYSSLVINSKKFPGVHQVFKPRFNKEYFKRITVNIGQLEKLIQRRYKIHDPLLTNNHLNDLRENSKKLVRLKERLDKTHHDDSMYEETLAQIQAIEDRIMPTVVRLPNRCSKLVPPEDVILDQVTSDFMSKQGLAKVLSHRKISYINNCYSKSVVGPNSHYYVGIGAKLQDAVSNYFTSSLEEEGFIPMSGMCLVKSAVVEATNAIDNKEFDRDPARILTDDHRYVTLHLTESSHEALVAMLTTMSPTTSNKPMRFMTQGAGYQLGSDWFDGNSNQITQYETLNTLTLNSSIEQYSMKEYLFTRDKIWSSYKKLEIPSRLVHCSLDSMRANEYDAHRIELWLPSRHEWLPVGRISHYLDHITVKVGMKRGHLIDSSVFDGQVMFASIIENRQTASGKFVIPEVLKNHMPFLTKDERSDFFNPVVTSTHRTGVLCNHEQRRYLTKRNYPFGHSQKAYQIERRQSGFREERFAIVIILIVFLLIDWTEFWYDYMPDGLREFMYDYMYRPTRRVWWYLVYERDKQPVDTPYRDLDRTEFERTMWERKKAQVLAGRGRDPAQIVKSDSSDNG